MNSKNDLKKLLKNNPVKILTILHVAIQLLSFIILTSSVNATEWVSRQDEVFSCVGEDCSFQIDMLQKFARYQVYHIFEVSGDLVHNIIKIDYFDTPTTEVCKKLYFESLERKTPWIFDVKIFKNDNQQVFEPFLNFNFLDNKRTVAAFPCYSPQVNDTITIDYYIGGGVVKKIRGEFYYPFDKYLLTNWNELDNVYYNRIDKVLLPNSFVPLESNNTCPAIGKILPSQNLKKFNVKGICVRGEYVGYAGGESGEFIDEKEKRIIVWPTLSSSPLKHAKTCYNILSEEQWNAMQNEKTGCFLSVLYVRTSIIKYIFIVSLILILLSTIYFLWSYNNDKSLWQRLFLVSSSAFTIWTFQEGLSSLTPLIRPTHITIFDLTLVTPLIFILVYLLIYCRRRIKK